MSKLRSDFILDEVIDYMLLKRSLGDYFWKLDDMLSIPEVLDMNDKDARERYKKFYSDIHDKVYELRDILNGENE